MVLRAADHRDRFAVAQREQGRDLSLQEVFDDDPGAGHAESATESRVNLHLGGREILGDDDALARGEAIGLDHKRRPVCPQRDLRRRRVVADGKTTCRQAIAASEFLGERL